MIDGSIVVMACGSSTKRKRCEGSQPDGKAGLALTFRQRSDPGTDQFGDHAGVVERESRDDPEQREDVRRRLPIPKRNT